MHSLDTIPVSVPGVIASIVETSKQGQVEAFLVTCIGYAKENYRRS